MSYRCFSFFVTDFRLLLIVLLFTFFLSSCGNGNDEKFPVALNDSTTPSDIRVINQKINNDRNNPDLYFQRAKSYFSHGDFQNAVSDMQIVLKIDSNKPDYYIFLSDLFFTQNKTRDTRDLLRKAIALDSSNSQALIKYSQLFFLLRKYDTATFYINRCLYYDNSIPVAHFQKGMILKEWGDTAKAISSFQSAVKLNQKYYDAYMQLGILHSAKNNPLALGYFDNALNINSMSIEAHYGKGKFLQIAGDYENALKEYNSILAISPEHQDATFNIGAIYYEQKKYDEAMQKFEMTIKRDQNFYRGYYGKGRCFEVQGEKQKAIDEYKKCLVIKPDYDLAAIQLDIIDKKAKKKI